MISKEKIIGFGFPKNTEDLKLQFQFTSPDCHCDSKSVKFNIYSLVNQELVFTMDFYIRNPNSLIDAFRNQKISEPHIRLQHIATCPPYRNKGIASFYLQKLHDFCSENGFSIITINVAPDSSKGLNKEQLFQFYNQFSSDSVEIRAFS